MTILSFAAIFAGLGLIGEGRDLLSAAMMVAGVVLGSALWWLFLSWIASVLRARIDRRFLRGINKVAGVALAVLAVAAIGSAVWVRGS